MSKEVLVILVDNAEVKVEMLGPRLARVVEPRMSMLVSKNDIVRLSHDPEEADAAVATVEIVHKINPVITNVTFWSDDARNRMIALAALLGGEIRYLEEIDYDLNRDYGRIQIAHDGAFDLRAIADAANVSRPPPEDEEEEEDDATGDDDSDERQAPPSVCNFDLYFKKDVHIPFFIWEDGEVRPFHGYCRGSGPLGVCDECEVNFGVFTKEGKYYSVAIDTRVCCATPQFWIDGKPFTFPIVSFATMGARVDPDTGRLNAAPARGTHAAADPQAAANDPGSTDAITQSQAEDSPGPSDKQ